MTIDAAVYGSPPRELADQPPGAAQVSPLIPGSPALEDLAPQSLHGAVVYAPPGAVERRYVLALTLRALRPGGRLTVLAPKDKGGSRLGKELAAFGATVEETARRHHRICSLTPPQQPQGLDEAIAAGSPRKLGPFWTQPGVFSWDRIDPGSAELAAHLPALSGAGADLGCGFGYLATVALASPKVEAIHLIDIDRRAVDCARRNLDDPRASFHWADATTDPKLSGLDFVISNPPFHASGHEDRGLGQAFIRRAADLLRKGGALYLVANRHLPYERVLSDTFSSVAVLSEAKGYKVFEATK